MKKTTPIIVFTIILILAIGSMANSIHIPTQNEQVTEEKYKIQSTSLLSFEKTSQGTIKAGASAQPITPDLNKHHPIYLAGFDRNRVATGIHDELWSRSCCMQIGNNTIAFVSVDLIGIMYPTYQRIIQQLPETTQIDRVILTSTHNHEGPDVIGLWGKGLQSGINQKWYDDTITTIRETIIESYNNMQPAGINIAHSMAQNMSRDSRNPKIMEEQVETIQFIDYENNPIATMVCYASHPEVLWNENTQITSDYPHYLYEHIENTIGGTALLITGPIGGLIIPKTRDHTFQNAKRFGETIANISLASINNTDPIWNTKVRLATQELFIPMTNPVFRLASILNILNRPLYQLRLNLKTSVNVIELGINANLAQIITLPGEDFPENWFEIKEKNACTTPNSHRACNR